jgi:selenocysteine lyase/cysteine desulfurase
MSAHLAHRDETACMDFLSWFEDHDRLRAKLAAFIGATPAEIAFIPNASTALGLLLAGLDWQPGDEFLTLEGEFPNNLYAAQFHRGRGVRAVETSWPRLLESLNPRTRAVAISTCNYVTGFRPPLEELSAECRRRGVLLYLDATQSLGAWPFDFAGVQPAILAVNCYKWMLAPNGAGFMAVREDVRNLLPPLNVGWRSDLDWRNVNHLHHGAPRFRQEAEKYEGGMLSSVVLYALEASLDLMMELGRGAIADRISSLAASCRRVLESAGGEVQHENTAILAARFPDRDATQLATTLKDRHVMVSARHGLLRVSTHFYNDESDVAALECALE